MITTICNYRKYVLESLFFLIIAAGLICLLTCTSNAIVLEGEGWMVASRYSEVSKSGSLMLQMGGNAFDAVIAMLASSGVVEPSHSGLGAELFIIAYSVVDDKVISINGGGSAPQASSIDWYRKHGGIPIEPSLLRATVPGALDAWITVLDKWGSMYLREVLDPAIRLAEGWVVNSLMEKVFGNPDIRNKLLESPSSKEVYYGREGRNILAGEIMNNNDLANTMKILKAAEKAGTTRCPCMGQNNRHQAMFLARNYFYVLAIAKEFGNFCESNEALLSYHDLASFQGRITTDLTHALIESPVHINYKGYDIYTCPSANQGPSLLEALNMIEKLNISSLEHNSAKAIHFMAESMNLAYADREKYLGDCNFHQVPLIGLLSKEYAEERISIVNPSERREDWPYGNPFPFNKPEYIYDGHSLPIYPEPLFPSTIYNKPSVPILSEVLPEYEEILIEVSKEIDGDIYQYENSYVCATDEWGNIVYATTSLTSPFGSGIVIKPLGFPLNSGVDYFRFEEGHPNALEPGKRPRSTLTPIIIFKEGKPYFACSAPNGDGEPQTLAQFIVNIIDYNMDIQEALDSPMWRSYCLPASKSPFTANPGGLSIDKRLHPETFKELEEMGWKVTVGKEFCNNPEFIIMIDEKDGTLKGAITSSKTGSIIAR